MSNEPIPRCPHCGAATTLDVQTLEAGVKDRWRLKCNTCGKDSDAGEWLKGRPDDEKGTD